MTDIPEVALAIPNRLGVSARMEDGDLRLELTPQAETSHHGVVRASVLSFLVDAAAGIPIDDDPSMWALTTDMSVRMRPVRAPSRIDTANTVLRRGNRSVMCAVDLTDDRGAPIASGAAGFARIPRREDDPPKPSVTPEQAVELFRQLPTLSLPLREAAGVEVIDAASGTVEMKAGPEVRNPAGTLQGAMVALLAESAAEGLVAVRAGEPVVVTDLDLRYLAQTRDGPVRTTCRQLGSDPFAPVEVRLVDTSNDRLTTLVYARAVPLPS